MRRQSLMAGLGIVLAACANVAPKPADPPLLVWPDVPDAPRVKFVKEFSRPDDLGIAKGFWERVADWVFGETEHRLVRPMAVVAANGVMFVADPGVKGVHRFEPAKGRHDIVRGEGGVPLPSPVGLARGAAGEVYVTDSALAAVFVIRPGVAEAARLPAAGLAQPTGIAFDSKAERLVVADTKAHELVVLERDGTVRGRIGKRGDRPGEFNFPTHLWRDARGLLYVTDSLNHRIQIFDPQGGFLRQFGQAGDAPGDFMRLKGVATDSFGHVYIVDALFGALQVFNPRGELLLSLGEIGRNRGEFWLPAGIFIDEDDSIYIADSYNRRVQVLRYIGGPT